jgi:hypothetical protein
MTLFLLKITLAQGGKCRTSRLCPNCASDPFSDFKSTIDLCYGIVAGVYPSQLTLTLKPKYFVVLPICEYNEARSVARNFPKGVPASGKTCRPCGSFFSPVLPSSHFFSKGCAQAPFSYPLATLLNEAFMLYSQIDLPRLDSS